MGQARRRKQQGLYPTTGQPEDFIAPAGAVSITIDVVGATSQSTVISARRCRQGCAMARS
jgi:hypothetical protein